MTWGDAAHVAHLHDVKVSLTRLPAMKSEKWVGVAAKMVGWIGPRNSGVEHSGYGQTIYRSLMNAETNAPAAVLVHDDQNPVRFQC